MKLKAVASRGAVNKEDDDSEQEEKKKQTMSLRAEKGNHMELIEEGPWMFYQD